jgi:hypothetical protein
MSTRSVSRLATRWGFAESESSDNDAGFTMAELVITMSLLVMVSIMAISVLLSTQRATKLVSWQSNANSQLRFISENTFAELETARPRPVCLDAGGRSTSTMPSNCSRVKEGVGSPLESAGEKHVCYLSYRADPAISDASATVSNSKIYNYVWVCLAIIGKFLYQVEWDRPAPPAVIADLNALPSISAGKYSVIGEVDAANSFFTYFGKKYSETCRGCTTGNGREDSVKLTLPSTSASTAILKADPAGGSLPLNDKLVQKDLPTTDPLKGQITGQIKTITRLQVKLAVKTTDGKHVRDAVYDVTLRGARYQNERCWTGEKVLKDSGASDTGSLSC